MTRAGRRSAAQQERRASKAARQDWVLVAVEAVDLLFLRLPFVFDAAVEVVAVDWVLLGVGVRCLPRSGLSVPGC